MKDNTEKLIEKLNYILDEKIEVAHKNASPEIFIKKDMNVETLTDNQIILTHTLLHKFYSSGNKGLTKNDIEQLHTNVKDKLKSHREFDKLDRI